MRIAPRLLRRSALVLAIALLVAACGSTAADTPNVYRDPQDRMLFELPDSWNLYDADAVASIPSAFIQDTGSRFTIVEVVAFDGAPGANAANLASPVSDAGYPIGAQLIRRVGPNDRDAVSRGLMAQYAYNPTDDPGVGDVFAEDFSFGDGYDGVRRQISLTDPNGNTTGVVYLIAVTDASDSTMYSIAAGCSLTCWNANADDIARLVDSWLVNTSQ